ncbi:AlbA family DNA-binding domain-containing protein [Rhodococcus globerulus]|uniref:ATP-binding protein n=1 Tax=Rhodococcus globerulus TaxID=33008 RepID=A0ABU4C283_RHOGO|nr:ATP-binding protein [Rhodococcus globerulus]MDV6270616.1 ATP-binding protein [Rhodococcus globerulus]
MLIIDGNVGLEKLTELLNSRAEDSALDFKVHYDLSRNNAKAKVEFPKDCAAMANLPNGGYIVIGVDGTGRPAHGHPSIVREHFDSSILQQKMNAYVDGTAEIVCVVHEVEGRDIALIHVRPPTDYLPVVMKADGTYIENGQTKTAFYKGQIITRSSSSNTPLEHRHWDKVLKTYDGALRKKAEKDASELLKVVLDEVRRLAGAGATAEGGVVPPPLSTHTDNDSFFYTAMSLAQAGAIGTERISDCLRTLVTMADSGAETDDDHGGDRVRALDQLCLIGFAAVKLDSLDLFDLVVDAYLEIYRGEFQVMDGQIVGGVEREGALRMVDILVRIFLLGSYIVRQKRWKFLDRLVHREVRLAGAYRYSSWIRHGLVQVSRAEVLRVDDGGKGGNILAVARARARETPALCRDITVTVEEQVSKADPLLNSLCQFDLWWCVIADLHADVNKFGKDFYTNFAVFHGQRTEPAVDVIANDDGTVRSVVFPDATEAAVASALSHVLESAEQESRNTGFHTEIKLSAAAENFIQQVGR